MKLFLGLLGAFLLAFGEFGIVLGRGYPDVQTAGLVLALLGCGLWASVMFSIVFFR